MDKKETLNIRLDSETKELFKQIAEKNNTSMSKLVEEFITKEIKKSQQSKKKVTWIKSNHYIQNQG